MWSGQSIVKKGVALVFNGKAAPKAVLFMAWAKFCSNRRFFEHTSKLK
jgi:hypothetical protein